MQLPDSEDPHVLLGVPPEVDARELKRAYVRLIKQFRPEQQPQEFQRIQQAYESVREVLRGASHTPAAHEGLPPEVERPEGHGGYVRAPAESASEPPRGLWQAGEAESARHEPSPSAARVATRSDATEPDEALLALRCHDADEGKRLFDALHARGELSWQVLRSRTDTHVALLLFDEHVERELVADRGPLLLSWLGSAEFEREVLRVPGLESVVWRVLCFTCMQAPEASLTLLRAHPGTAQASDPNLVLLEETLPLAGTYRRVREKVAIPPWLSRLLELGALESYEGSSARQLNAALAADSAGLLRTLDDLQREAPMLLKRVLSTVDRWLPPDDRLVHELSSPERAWLTATLGDIDAKLDGSIVAYSPILLLGALVVGGYFSFAQLGFWLGLPACLLLGVVLSVAMVRVDRRAYERRVRGLLVSSTALRGVSPDRVVEFVTTHKEKTGNVDRFQREIREDLPLYALAALCRVSEKLNARNAFVVPERVVIEHAQVKAEVVAMVPGAAAAAMTCTSHPERKSVHMCSGCARALCSTCTREDPMVAPFCTGCVAPRNLALRKALEEQESNYRGTGSCILLFATVLLLLAVGDIDNGNMVFARNTGAAAAVVFLIGLSLRLLWPVARYTLLLFSALIVWLFPVGTALAFMAVKFAFSARAKRVFSEEYRSALATTPPMRIPFLYRSLDALAVLGACLSLWLFVR